MAEKVKNKEEKKQNQVKKTKKTKEGFFKGVRKELKLVKWPSFKEVLKYTCSTIVLCVILCAFFLLLNLGLSFVKGLFV